MIWSTLHIDFYRIVRISMSLLRWVMRTSGVFNFKRKKKQGIFYFVVNYFRFSSSWPRLLISPNFLVALQNSSTLAQTYKVSRTDNASISEHAFFIFQFWIFRFLRMSNPGILVDFQLKKLLWFKILPFPMKTVKKSSYCYFGKFIPFQKNFQNPLEWPLFGIPQN